MLLPIQKPKQSGMPWNAYNINEFKISNKSVYSYPQPYPQTFSFKIYGDFGTRNWGTWPDNFGK